MKSRTWTNLPRLRLSRGRMHAPLPPNPRVMLLRLFALLITGVLLSIIAPVIADENEQLQIEPMASAQPSPSGSPSESPIPSDSPSPTDFPIPASSDGAQSDPQNSSTAQSDSLTASAEPSPQPPAPADNQRMKINVPSVLPVDPRAKTRNLPAIQISGDQYLLACISSDSLTFDIYQRNVRDSYFAGDQLVSGDLSKNLYISGTHDQVLALINSYGGLRIFDETRGVAGSIIRMSFIALTQPLVDPSFCGQGSVANNRFISVRALGLGMILKKNDLVLKG